jgi:manganese transport protein
VLHGRRRGLKALLPFLGPSVVVSVAYVDPGNYATNIQAGATSGYELMWVVAAASLIAMFFQALSAKLGIASGRNLAELCRERLPWPVVIALWIASEIAAMATDVAEFLGGAIGISLLFGLPLWSAMVIMGVVTFALLSVQSRGFRPIELVIGGFVVVIGLSYVIELAIAPIDWPALLHHTVVPQLSDSESLTLAVGILGATVMPHAIYLHSGLTYARIAVNGEEQRRRLVSFSNKEVVITLAIAGLVNMAMLAMSASVLYGSPDAASGLAAAYRTLIPLMGTAAAVVFLVSLIASGLSSSTVGTMAGQMIMQGFAGFPIPLWVRRLVTMVPSFIVVAMGVNPTEALILTQVILSLVLPVPLVALTAFTANREIMGGLVNRRVVTLVAIVAAAMVIMLNAMLVVEAIGL